jgi:hypothetical protein
MKIRKFNEDIDFSVADYEKKKIVRKRLDEIDFKKELKFEIWTLEKLEEMIQALTSKNIVFKDDSEEIIQKLKKIIDDRIDSLTNIIDKL